MSVSWRGVFPAACTQFHADHALNISGTLAHVEAMLQAGIHGLVMLGTVGENCSLEAHEKREVLKATVEHVRGRVPVLTGVAEYTTSLACKWAAEAQKKGLVADTAFDIDSSSVIFSILEYARKKKPGMIAMASESGAVSAALLGSVGRGVAREAPCPVWFLRS